MAKNKKEYVIKIKFALETRARLTSTIMPQILYSVIMSA